MPSTREDRDIDDSAAMQTTLDQLLYDARLYTRGDHYKELLEFVVQVRNFAPFNAMLLQIQKPGLRFAASAHEWRTRYGRDVRPYARPLLILWPFGPVAPVYDYLDTEGKPLPRDLEAFWARGPIDQSADMAFEAVVLRHPEEFSEEAVRCSRERLADRRQSTDDSGVD